MNSYMFWQISHFLLKSIKNIKKSYMFWNGLNKTEISEKTQKANFYQNSLCFSQNQWTFEWGLKN